METVVVDASVLIDGVNGVPAAQAYLSPLRVRGALAVHPVGYAEVLEGALNARMFKQLDDGLRPLRLLRVKGDDFLRALELMRTHFLAASADWGDCLMAATCLRLGLPLATLNDKHFRPIRGLKVIRPY